MKSFKTFFLENLEQVFIDNNEEVEFNEAKLDRQTHTVGAHHLQRDSGDHKMYTSYTGSQVRRLHTVTDKDDNILGQGMSAASAMAKAKLKKAHRDALIHDDNQIIKVHDTRGKYNVGTQVATPGKGRWFKDHDEAMKYAKSLPGKIRHADEKGHVYSESVKIDEAKKPKPGHNAAVLAKNISKVLSAVKKEEVELDEAGYDAEYVKRALPHLKNAVEFHKDYEGEHIKKSVSGTPEYVRAHRAAADAHKHAAQKFKIAHAQLSHGTKDVEYFVSDARAMGAHAEKLTAAANKIK